MAENTGSGDFSIRLDGLITCWMKITVQFLCWMKVPEEWRLTVHSALLFSGWCSCTTVSVIRALFWNKEVYFCSVHHWLSSLRSSLTQLLEMQWSLRKLKHRNSRWSEYYLVLVGFLLVFFRSLRFFSCMPRLQLCSPWNTIKEAVLVSPHRAFL